MEGALCNGGCVEPGMIESYAAYWTDLTTKLDPLGGVFDELNVTCETKLSQLA